MIEQQRLGDDLKEIDQVIVAAHVDELMGEHRFELLGRQAEEHGDRQQDDGLKPTDDERRLDEQGLEDAHGAGEMKAVGELLDGRADGGGGGFDADDAEALGGDPTTEPPHAEEQHTERPAGGKPRRERCKSPGDRHCRSGGWGERYSLHCGRGNGRREARSDGCWMKRG